MVSFADLLLLSAVSGPRPEDPKFRRPSRAFKPPIFAKGSIFLHKILRFADPVIEDCPLLPAPLRVCDKYAFKAGHVASLPLSLPLPSLYLTQESALQVEEEEEHRFLHS